MFLLDESLPTEYVAKELLGCLLVHHSDDGITSGWIVETEAYIGEKDEACHSYRRKRTPRLIAMYDKPGTIYLYQMHGHILLNIVTQPVDVPHAVLIRAIEPVQGKELMINRRIKSGIELTNGPGKLTQAMGITMDNYGTMITSKSLFIDITQRKKPLKIESSPRIGIPNKGEWTKKKLRYTVKGNPYISKYKGTTDQKNHGWI